jgi:hypothetical protein
MEEKIPSAPASEYCGANEVCEVYQIKLDNFITEYFENEKLDAYKNIETYATLMIR